jgi:type I restriction enzyme, S subunit
MAMDKLPLGWTPTTLGEICTKPQYGWTTKAKKNGVLKYIRTSDISTGKINWARVPYCDKAPNEINKYKVWKDDILIARAGSVGVSHRIQTTDTDAVFASYLIRFRPHNEIIPAYIELYLNTNDFWNAISEKSAVIAIPNVNASKLSKLEIPLPPYEEQRRIVAKLENSWQK